VAFQLDSSIIEPADALRYIDFSTIILLFSMMLIVAYLHLPGFFAWITEAEIGFRDYLQVGAPVTLATLLFGGFWLWVIK
jgi:Na+/H+ antiporter NhaD/arsenite permease-like protein